MTTELEETILFHIPIHKFNKIMIDFPKCRAHLRIVSLKRQIYLKRVRDKVREAIFIGLANKFKNIEYLN